MPTRRARLLILCKTYPSPSSQYVETSCVAAMEETGQLVRLYPVPFRLMQDEAQFKKWQWIEADVEKARKDRRPESHQIRVDNLHISGDVLSTANAWAARRVWLDRLHLYTTFGDLDGTRVSHGVTLGLLKPAQILSLEIEPARYSNWTDDERAKLLQAQNQGSLFAEAEQDIKLPVLGSERCRVETQNLRLGSGGLVLERRTQPRRKLANSIPQKVGSGVATAGPNVLDGNVAPVPGPVAHREPDLPA